jgi:SAM-dependent methyltransferase
VSSAEQSEALDAVRRALEDASPDGLVRAIATGRRRNQTVPFRRLELRYVELKAGPRLQVTSYDETQAHVRNFAIGDESTAEIGRVLREPYSHWHVETARETLQLRFTKKGRPLLHRTESLSTAPSRERSHDRMKRRQLDEADPLFRELGMATADGRVKPSRMAKFRQVQDLLTALEPVVDHAMAAGPGDALSEQRPLEVVDLGCGNAYLTFGAFRFLTSVREVPVHVVGVDVKAQSRVHNSEIAAALGVAEQLEFVQSSISEAEVANPPDLVLALHACDTATDDALARAVRWQAPVIIAAPCCHHDVQRQLAGQQPPQAYDLVTRHGILRERLADVLTDAFRAAILRLAGYRVEVFEFVDTQHTPRNALIRAVRTEAAPTPGMVDAYHQLTSEWGVVPALATRLADLYPELLSLGVPDQQAR